MGPDIPYLPSSLFHNFTISCHDQAFVRDFGTISGWIFELVLDWFIMGFTWLLSKIKTSLNGSEFNISQTYVDEWQCQDLGKR